MAAHFDVVAHAHIVEQRHVLERAADTEPWNGVLRLGKDRSSFEQDIAFTRDVESRQAVEECGFARAVWTDQAGDQAPGDVEADAVERDNAAEAYRYASYAQHCFPAGVGDNAHCHCRNHGRRSLSRKVLLGADAPHVGLSDRLAEDIGASVANGPEGFSASGPCGLKFFRRKIGKGELPRSNVSPPDEAAKTKGRGAMAPRPLTSSPRRLSCCRRGPWQRSSNLLPSGLRQAVTRPRALTSAQSQLHDGGHHAAPVRARGNSGRCAQESGSPSDVGAVRAFRLGRRDCDKCSRDENGCAGGSMQ